MTTAETAAVIAACASSVTALTAIVAAVFGTYQLRILIAGNNREEIRQAEIKERENLSKKNSAETIWRQYELLCIRHPDFACPELSKLDINRKTFDGTVQKFISYEYFVSFLLYACEDIEEVYGDEQDWIDSILDELDWHQEYLTSEYFSEYLPTIAPKIRQIIEEMKKRPGDKRHRMS
jgi:hypothetical protein